MIPGLGRSSGEGIGDSLPYSSASLVAQLIKNPPAMQETWVQSLDLEDPLEKGTPEEFYGLYSPWDSPGQNTGVGSLFLLHRIFPTQGLNPGLLHCRWILYQLSHQGNPTVQPNILQNGNERNLRSK